MMILSNEWWTWVWATYNYSILGFPVVISFVLKLIAVFNPNVPSDKIIELINVYWPKGKQGSPT